MLTCRVDSNCDDKVRYSHDRLPLSLLVLPTFNKPLMDKLRRKDVMTSKKFSQVSRELGRDIYKNSLHTHPEAFRHMAKHFLTAYPHVVISTCVESTVVSTFQFSSSEQINYIFTFVFRK